MKNVRALAAQILMSAEKKFVDEALDDQRGASLSRRDKALLTTLVYGVTRWRRELDWLIDRCAERVHAEIRQHLRLALFQIRHLDKIPRHAAVNEAVELAKGVSRKSAGFVNASWNRSSSRFGFMAGRVCSSRPRRRRPVSASTRRVGQAWARLRRGG